MPLWRRKHWDETFDESYADRTRERPINRPKRWFPHLVGLTLVGVLFLGAVGAVGGQTMFEKSLTALVQPCGIIWLGMLATIYFSLIYRATFAAVLTMGLWLLFTISGNSLVAGFCAEQLEADYVQLDPLRMERFDTVFLFGGGTETRLGGQAQLNGNGDRLVVAAKMYHAGKVKRIICTGTQTFRSTEKDSHPREEAALLLEQLAVPAEAIQQIKGQNTSVEIANIKVWMEANPNQPRIGVLSSAWHLPRIERLLSSNGISAIPIPADFMSGYYAPSPSLLIPSADNLQVTGRAVKEFVAGLVDR